MSCANGQQAEGDQQQQAVGAEQPSDKQQQQQVRTAASGCCRGDMLALLLLPVSTATHMPLADIARCRRQLRSPCRQHRQQRRRHRRMCCSAIGSLHCSWRSAAGRPSALPACQAREWHHLKSRWQQHSSRWRRSSNAARLQPARHGSRWAWGWLRPWHAHLPVKGALCLLQLLTAACALPAACCRPADSAAGGSAASSRGCSSSSCRHAVPCSQQRSCRCGRAAAGSAAAAAGGCAHAGGLRRSRGCVSRLVLPALCASPHTLLLLLQLQTHA